MFVSRTTRLLSVAVLLVTATSCTPRDSVDQDHVPDILSVPEWTGPSDATLDYWSSLADTQLPEDSSPLLEAYRDSRHVLGRYAHGLASDEEAATMGDFVDRYQELAVRWTRENGADAFRELGVALWPSFLAVLEDAADAAADASTFDQWMADEGDTDLRRAYLGLAGDYMRAAQELGLRDRRGQLLGDASTERLLFAQWWSQQLPGWVSASQLARSEERADYLRFLALNASEASANERYTWWREAERIHPHPDGPDGHLMQARFLVEEGRHVSARRALERSEGLEEARKASALRWLEARD